MKCVHWFLAMIVMAGGVSVEAETNPTNEKPNIIFILADDLGYGDLGCYGQKIVSTPRIDAMAANGMRFTNFYAGATVCAPSRCTLMTGFHNGHAQVRGNGSAAAQSLRDEDVTIAEVLRNAGYHTALVGKWGLGQRGGGEEGLPNRQGFDSFFGYNHQGHAHNPYPTFLWRNDEKVMLGNEVQAKNSGPWGESGYATKKVEHSQDLFCQEAVACIAQDHQRPFFLYLSLTIPHANNEATQMTGDGQEVDDYGIYADRDWPNPDKGFAAMVTMMDDCVGKVIDQLKASGIENDTLVIFTSDNGHHKEGGNSPDFFDSNGPLRGMKRDLYEGGIRVPFIAFWPGTVPAGTNSDHIGYFGDFFATACDLAGIDAPPHLDSISIAPTLVGKPEKQVPHDHIYWEFYEGASAQAVRKGDWKAVRKPMLTGSIELYDLAKDLGETTDVSSAHPELVGEMTAIMEREHRPHPLWKTPAMKKLLNP